MIGHVGTRYVSIDEREVKRRRRREIGIALFVIRLPAIFLTPVIPHDLGGFSLRSKALRDKTVQIEFDSYQLLYSAVNLVFAIEAHTSVLNWLYLYCSFKTAAFCFSYIFPFPSLCLFRLQTMKKKKVAFFTLFECR